VSHNKVFTELPERFLIFYSIIEEKSEKLSSDSWISK